mmetsp:Transcript_56994/g.144669  ORF Transcript_56994/g.144669 Transcript_56994/m.144669 type:complete len:256 (-) Transcript_56994:1588-2355(-)
MHRECASSDEKVQCVALLPCLQADAAEVEELLADLGGARGRGQRPRQGPEESKHNLIASHLPDVLDLELKNCIILPGTTSLLRHLSHRAREHLKLEVRVGQAKSEWPERLVGEVLVGPPWSLGHVKVQHIDLFDVFFAVDRYGQLSPAVSQAEKRPCYGTGAEEAWIPRLHNCRGVILHLACSHDTTIQQYHGHWFPCFNHCIEECKLAGWQRDVLPVLPLFLDLAGVQSQEEHDRVSCLGNLHCMRKEGGVCGS